MKRFRMVAAVVAAAVLLFATLFFTVDLVRQNAELLLLKITGRMWTLRGELRSVNVPNDALKAPRLTYIYTPPGYKAGDKSRTYPVLYLLHGYPDFGDMGWVKFGRAPQLIDELIVDGKIPPIIVVAPSGQGVGGFGDSEYVDAVNPATANKPGARMMEFIAEDLPHWVDANYNVAAEPSKRWIGGASTGAYGAVNIALQHPLQFGAAISLSGYYTADDSGDARPVWGYHPTRQQLQAQSPAAYVTSAPDKQWRNSFFYIAYGTHERSHYRNEADTLVRDLRAAGVPCVLRSSSGKHSWDLWRTQLIEAVQIVAKQSSTTAPAVKAKR
ncbi:MAG TPA: alpha/beta hydrolase-fold protein [Capsulimonadaceae bacterium]|jgi:enterochelin esterase-like enzyme